ncbi:hypothetical protein LG311_19020 [Sutcliffiella horikoshii]|uniref:hypothetical protein n=1 Tax=Sutcliffiella horikoshii TaxID=79883 RepID=UPI00384DBC64
MIQLELKVKDVYALKESLKVAHEVTYSDLSFFQNEAIRSFTKNITSDSPIVLIYPNLKEDLIICLNIFKTSRTWHWLKEDFKNAVNDFIYILKN